MVVVRYLEVLGNALLALESDTSPLYEWLSVWQSIQRGMRCRVGIYVVDELIQLTAGSDAQIIVNSYWTEDLRLCHTREVSVTQLLIEIIVAPICKSDPALDIQTDIIFAGIDGAKFLDYIESIVIGRNLRFNMPHVTTCQ